MKTLKFGDITISKIVETSMHASPQGLLPDSNKELIEKHREWLFPHFMTPSEEIILSFHTYIVQSRHHTVLVDTCWGNQKTRLTMPPGHMLNTPYLDTLKKAGVGPEQVDFVVCTHMHLDHVGWNTQLKDGRWTPTFPRAKYLFGRADWEHYQTIKEGEFNHDAFVDSVIPVVEAGQAIFVNGHYAIEDYIQIEPLPGHTPGHVGLRVGKPGNDAIMTGDMAHHVLQFAEPHLNSSACVVPDLARKSRQEFVAKHVDTNTIVLAAHFPEPTAGQIRRYKDAFKFQV